MVWQKRYSPDIRTAISDAHEYILCYAKDPKIFKESRNLLPLTEAQTKQFTNPDNDPRGLWKAIDFTAPGYRPNQMYEIQLPSGRIVTPPAGRCWRVTVDGFNQFKSENKMYYGKDGNGVPSVKKIFYQKCQVWFHGLGGNMMKLVIHKKGKKKANPSLVKIILLLLQNLNA